MFQMMNLSQQNFSQDYGCPDCSSLASQALKLYRNSMSTGKLQRIWSKIRRHPNRLLDLNSQFTRSKVRSQHYGGVKPVLINQIIGTEGRLNDFDASFNPLNEKTRDRWLSIATARLLGTAMPAVELIQVGDFYFVRDGHHRISVARAFGEEAIDAEITIWDVNRPLPWEKETPMAQLCPEAV
jgi:hypothetical protein